MRAVCVLLVAAIAACSRPATVERRPGGDALETQIQYALEHLVSGVRSTAVIRGTRVVIVPLRTWKTPDGVYCRRFEITVTPRGGPGKRARQTRCRLRDGIWHPVKGD